MQHPFLCCLGVFGIPIDVVAVSLLEALTMHDSMLRPSSTLREVHIVDVVKQNIQAIIGVLQQNISSKIINPTRSAWSTTSGQQSSSAVHSRDKVRQYTTSGITVPDQMDVICSKEHSELTLSKKEDECPICFDKTALKRLPCKHGFCESCLQMNIKYTGEKCPVCNQIYGRLTGDQPTNGQMDVYIDEYIDLPGYYSYGTIVIKYTFQSGIQTVCTYVSLNVTIFFTNSHS